MRLRLLFLVALAAAGTTQANQQYWTTLENDSGVTGSSLRVETSQPVNNPFARSAQVWGNDPDGQFLTATGGGTSTLNFSNWSPGGAVPIWQEGYPNDRYFWVDVGWTDTNAYDDPVHVESYQWNTGRLVAHPLQFLVTLTAAGGSGVNIDLYNPSSVAIEYAALECWTNVGPPVMGNGTGPSPCLAGVNVPTAGWIGAEETLRVASFVPQGMTYLRASDLTNDRTVVAGGNAGPEPVPEPATAALMGAGALLAIVAARRRRGRT